MRSSVNESGRPATLRPIHAGGVLPIRPTLGLSRHAGLPDRWCSLRGPSGERRHREMDRDNRRVTSVCTNFHYRFEPSPTKQPRLLVGSGAVPCPSACYPGFTPGSVALSTQQLQNLLALLVCQTHYARARAGENLSTRQLARFHRKVGVADLRVARREVLE